MSEPNDETTVMSAAEAAELRNQLAEANRLREAAEAKAMQEGQARVSAVRLAIEARADAFVTDFCGRANKTTHALSIREAFLAAATDDHEHPRGSAPTFRQDALRAALSGRAAATGEKVNADPDQETRALPSDPAPDTRAEDAEAREARRQKNHAYIQSRNGPAR